MHVGGTFWIGRNGGAPPESCIANWVVISQLAIRSPHDKFEVEVYRERGMVRMKVLHYYQRYNGALK